MWFLIIVVILVVLLVIYLIAAYNGLIRRRNQIENAWSQIDVQLKRRLDLIPNLVETVKGYAAHEKETLDAVIRARNAAIAAPRFAERPGRSRRPAHRRPAAAVRARRGVPRPQGQPELPGPAGRARPPPRAGSPTPRQFYNDTVLDYNNKLQQFPTVFFARMLKFEKREYFEADEAARTAPTVEF